MFKINKETRLFNSGTSQKLTSKIVAICAATMLSGGLAYADNPKDNIQIMQQQLENRGSVFQNLTTNKNEVKDSNNTVMIVLQSNDKQNVSWGTGVVVADSGNSKNPYNRILTSVGATDINLLDKNANPKDFGKMMVFNANGNLIATAEIEAHGPYQDLFSEDTKAHINANVSVLKVTGITERYKQMSGVKIAKTIPDNCFHLNIDNGIGPGPGFSGSPVFDSNGDIVGLGVSYNYNDNNMQQVYKTLIDNHGKYKLNIPEYADNTSVVSNVNLKGNLLNKIPSKSSVNIASIGDENILKSLNKAGQDVKYTSDIPNNIVMMGYTNDIGMVQKGKPTKTLDMF